MDVAMSRPQEPDNEVADTGKTLKNEKRTGQQAMFAAQVSKWRQYWRMPAFRNIVLTVLLVITAATITELIPFRSITIPRPHTTGNTKTDVVVESVDVLAEFIHQLLGNNNLPPKAQSALVNNLRMVHADITYTESEIKKNPNDANLRALLLNLYQQQSDLMNEAQQAQIQTLPGAGS
jgi:hypothetical protein